MIPPNANARQERLVLEVNQPQLNSKTNPYPEVTVESFQTQTAPTMEVKICHSIPSHRDGKRYQMWQSAVRTTPYSYDRDHGHKQTQ